MLKRNLRTRVLPLVFAMSLALAPINVGAGGFPTFDAVNLAQAITGYIQMIETYEETLAQTVLNESQLTTMLDQYTQILKEYDLLLKQAEALKNKLSTRDYEAWAKTAMIGYKFKPFNFDDIRIATDSYSQAGVSSSNSRYGTRANKAELDALAGQVYGSTPDDINRSYNHANMAADQYSNNERYVTKNIESVKRVEAVDFVRQNMGDQSQLATLQLIAEQNQILMEQNQISNDLMQKQFEMSNQFENQYFSNQQQAKERQMQRFIDAKNTPIILNETQMVPK